MAELLKTVLHEKHVSLGATMVDFGGWHMPLQYRTGIVEEHLATRKSAGLFDVSHMGRFIVRGSGALALPAARPFQQRRRPGYRFCTVHDDPQRPRAAPSTTPISTASRRMNTFWWSMPPTGTPIGAICMPMLSRFPPSADGGCLRSDGDDLPPGTPSRAILQETDRHRRCSAGTSQECPRSAVDHRERKCSYPEPATRGNPWALNAFSPPPTPRGSGTSSWRRGRSPVGLGARDTLRLEAGLPLFGHELGKDPAGTEIPIFACPLARFAVSFSPLKGAFVGREALATQFAAFKKIQDEDYTSIGDLPRIIMPFALRGKGIARAGFRVFQGPEEIGFVTSGTMVPYWKTDGRRGFRPALPASGRCGPSA